MSPFVKVAATIGVVWLVALGVITIVYLTGYKHYPGSGRNEYHTAAYIGQIAIATGVAIVAIVIAAVWAGRKPAS